MPYRLMTCRVLRIDLDKRYVELAPVDGIGIQSIKSESGKGLKFLSHHAPLINPEKVPITGKINNVAVGHVNYPSRGDIVLAAVWHTDYSKSLRPQPVQNMLRDVVVLGTVVKSHPYLGVHDRVIGDSSGAKIHFNHGWLDIDNLENFTGGGEDTESPPRQQKNMGHVTLVGNRVARLAGQKFLAFGLLSHLLGKMKKEGDDRSNPGITAGNETVAWDSLFTIDPTEDVYDDCLDGESGGKKFLQPPCPEPGTLMDMHDSGYKRLVESDGHVREYSRGGIYIHGDDGSDTYKKEAFDPSGEEAAAAEGEVRHRFKTGSSEVIVIIKPGGAIEVDITAAKVKITGDLEVTGEVKGGTGTFG